MVQLLGISGGSWDAPLSGNNSNVALFLEFLHENSISPGEISNYLMTIRALYIVYGLDTNAFKNERLSLFLKH